MAGNVIVFIQNKFGETKGILSNSIPKACPFQKDRFKETRKTGWITLEMEVPADHPTAELLELENKILYPDNFGRFRMLTIKDIDESQTDANMKFFYAEGTHEELLDSRVRPFSFVNSKPELILSRILEGQIWRVGNVESVDEVAMETKDYPTTLKGIQDLAEITGLYPVFRVEYIHESGEKDFIVDLLRRRGSDKGKMFDYTKDILSLKRKRHSRELYTAVLALGKSDDAEKRLTVAGISFSKQNGEPFDKELAEDTILDPVAAAEWGVRVGVYENNDQEDPHLLGLEAWEWLQENNAPAFSYEVKAVDLGTLAGLTHENFDIGDTVKVRNLDLKPPLLIEAEIEESTRSHMEPEADEFEFGNFRDVYDRERDKLADIIDLVNRRSGAWSVKGRTWWEGPTAPDPAEYDTWLKNDVIPHIWHSWSETGKTWNKATATDPGDVGTLSAYEIMLADDEAEAAANNFTIDRTPKIFYEETAPGGDIPLDSLWLDLTNKTWNKWNGTVWLSYSITDLSELDGIIVETQLADGAVSEQKMQDLAVTLGKIGAGAVDNSKVVDRTLAGAKIILDGITNDLMAVDSINTEQILGRAMTSAKIALDNITNDLIAASAITNDLMADNSVSTAEIVGRSMTSAKIALNNVTNDLMAIDSVGTTNIVNRALTSGKIALDNITNDLMAVNSIGTAEIVGRAMTSAKIALDNITNDLMAIDAIGTSEIQARALTSGKIALDAVTNDLIAANAITNDLMADNSVSTAEIVGRSMTSAKIALNNVTNDLMAIDSVGTTNIVSRALTSGKIALDNITNDLIAASAITNDLMADNSVGTAEIVGRAMTSAKIALDNITNDLMAVDAIGTSEIQARALTSAKIALDAVTNDLIANAAITNDLMAANSVGTTQMVDRAMTGVKIALAGITGAEISDRTINAAKLIANSITANEIAANAITADEIAANAVTANKILAGSIQTDHIVATGIDAKVITAGTIGAQHIAVGPATTFAAGFDPAEKVSVSMPYSTPNTVGTQYNKWSKVAEAYINARYQAVDFLMRFTGSAAGNAEKRYAEVGFRFKQQNAMGEIPHIQIAYISGQTILPEHFKAILTTNTAGATILEVFVFIPHSYEEYFYGIYDKVVMSSSGVDVISNQPLIPEAELPAGTSWTGKDLSHNPATGLVRNWQHLDTTYIAGGSIFTNSLTANQIASNAIATDELAANAVTAGKITGRTITADKIVSLSLTANEIAGNTITAAKITGRTITAAEIVAGTLTANELGANSVTASEITGRTITAEKLVAGSITANEIAGATITANKLVANTITANEIAANAITADELAANSVTANKILAGSIQTDHIVATGIDAKVIKAGVIGAEHVAIGSGTTFANGFDPTKIEVGGRNYTFDANFSQASKWWSFNGGGTVELINNAFKGVRGVKRTITGTTNIWGGVVSLANNHLLVNPGEEITASIWTYVHTLADSISLEIEFINSVGTRLYTRTAQIPNVLNEWKKTILTVAVPDNSEIHYARIRAYVVQSGSVTYAMPKIERGNRATDFTLAPEDTEEAISGAVKPANDRIALWQHLDTTYIAGGSIFTNSLTANEIAANAIATDELAANAVTAAKITGRTITADKIVSLSLTANEIAGNTITAAKITGRTITATEIVAGTLTANELGANSVTASEITGRTITADKLVAGSITANEISGSTITANELAANSVAASEIVGRSITADKLVANSITANEIAATTITAAEIAAGTITAKQIAANSITTEELIIGDFTNLAQNPEFNTGNNLGWQTPAVHLATEARVPTGAPTKYVARTSSRDVYNKNTFEVQPGERYLVSATVATPDSTHGFNIGLNVHNKDKTSQNWLVGRITEPTTAWKNGVVEIVIPNGFKFARMFLQIPATSSFGNWYFTEARVMKKSDGKLIVDGSITAKHVFSNTLTANEIASNAITADEITGRTITAAKIVSNNLTANEIAATTITAAQIVARTITANEIYANTITAGEIATNAITADEIAANSVAASEIVSYTITAMEIASRTISADRIIAGSITANEISVNTITGDKLVINSITAREIAANQITTDHISTVGIDAAVLKAGSVIASTVKIAGELVGATGTFSGSLSAATGTFAGTVSVGSATNSTYNTKVASDGVTLQSTLYKARLADQSLKVEDISGTYRNSSELRPNGLDLRWSEGTTAGADYKLFLDSAKQLRLTSSTGMKFLAGEALEVRVRGFTHTKPDFVMDTVESYRHARFSAGNTALKFLNSSSIMMQVRNREDTAYSPLAASEVIVTSNRKYKKNISKFEKSTFKDFLQTPIMEYNMIEDNDGYRKHIGALSDNIPAEIAEMTGEGIDLYAMTAYKWRTLQELIILLVNKGILKKSDLGLLDSDTLE